jgi:hypothetical protein
MAWEDKHSLEEAVFDYKPRRRKVDRVRTMPFNKQGSQPQQQGMPDLERQESLAAAGESQQGADLAADLQPVHDHGPGATPASVSLSLASLGGSGSGDGYSGEVKVDLGLMDAKG